MSRDAFLRVGIDGAASAEGARVFKRSIAEMKSSAEDFDKKFGSGTSMLNKFFNDLGFSAKGLYRSIITLASSFALLEIGRSIINGIINSFKFAFNAVEDFKINVASMSAVIMTFMDRSSGLDTSGMWKASNEYAKYMIPTLELISAKMLITGQQATLLFTELTKGRIALDASNKAAVAGFVSLGNAIAILTKGQDPERQIMTETRALMTGTAQAGSMLVRLVEVLDPMYKSHLKTWRETGTALEHFGDLLSGFNAASLALSTTWTALSTTIRTLTIQIMRGGMSTAYDSIIASIISIRDGLIEHRSILMQGVHRAWLSIAGTVESIWNLLKPFTPFFTSFAGLVNLIGYGLEIIGSSILPVITERMGAFISGFIGIINPLGHLLDAASAAVSGEFSLAVNKLKLIKGDFEKMGNDFGRAFKGGITGSLDEIVTRFNNFNKDFSTNLPPVKPPKFSPMEPDEDKTLMKQNQLAEIRLKDNLAMIKHYHALTGSALDYQFRYDLITAEKYYDSKAELISKDSQAEIKAIEKQIELTSNLKKKMQTGIQANEADIKSNPIGDIEELSKRLDGLDKQKSKAMEYDIKIAGYESEIHKTKMKEQSDLQQLYAKKLDYLKQEYDYLHRNDDLRNKIEVLKVAEDPFTSGLLAIQQRYKKEIDFAKWMYEEKKKLGIASLEDERQISLLKEARVLEENNFKKAQYSDAAQALATSLNTVGEILMKGNKRQFETGKQLAIVSTIIDTYVSASKAAASLAAFPPIAAVAAAAMIFSGMARVAVIQSQHYTGYKLGGRVNIVAESIKRDSEMMQPLRPYGFGQRGLIPLHVGTIGKDSVPAMLEPGEVVINKRAVDFYGVDNVISINEFRKRKFKLGGFVGDIVNTGSKIAKRIEHDATNPKDFLSDISGWTTFNEIMEMMTPKVQDLNTAMMTQTQLDADLAKRLNIVNGATADQMKIYDLLISQQKELNDAQVSGLDTSQLVAVQFKELDKVMRDIAIAQIKAKVSFQNDITSRNLRASGNTVGADLFDLKLKQMIEFSDAVKTYGQEFVDSMGLAQLQTTEYSNAVEEALKAIPEAVRKLKDNLSKILDNQLTISQTIVDILTGPSSMLSPERAYIQAKHRVDIADESAMPEAVKAFLEASKNYNASGPTYQEDLQWSLSKLGSMIGLTGTPTLDMATKQVSLLTDIKDAITTGNLNLLKALTLETSGGLQSSLNVYLSQIAANTANITGASGGGGGGTIPNPTPIPVPKQRPIQWAKDAVGTQNAPGPAMQMIMKIIPPDLQYDVAPLGAPDKKLSLGDVVVLQRMALGLTPLPYYASGTPSLGSDQVVQAHKGEMIMDARSTEVFHKYGIKIAPISRSTDNSKVIEKLTEQIAELKEQNRQLALLVRTTQSGFMKSIEVASDQNRKTGVLVNKTRLANAS